MQSDPAVQSALLPLFGRSLEEKIICLKLGITQRPRCRSCAAEILSMPHSTRGFSAYCSKRCSAQGTAASNLKKRSATMLERYGATGTLGAADLRAKAEATMIDRYGAGFGSAPEVRHRITETNIVRYGGASPAASAAVAVKSAASKIARTAAMHQRNIEALGYDFEAPLRSMRAPARVTHRCGASHLFDFSAVQRYPICPSCEAVPGSSAAEREIGDFVESLGFEVIRRAKLGSPRFEIDVLVPALQLGIEYHGLYWHSSAVGTAPMKHQQRRAAAAACGVQLIQIFEDEYLLKKEIVLSVLAQKLKRTARTVFARRCEVRDVPPAEATEFFTRTHLGGAARSTLAVGLYLQNQLLACAGVARSRYHKGGFELIRFSTELNTTVPGALSRLLKRLPRPLISYCDLRFGEGGGYRTVGFKDLGDTAPGYWYFKRPEMGRVHRSMLQRKKMLRMLPNSEEMNLKTERELAAELGYNAIYDAGHRRFLLET